MTSSPETRQGIGVSPGTAYGPVVQVAPPVRPPANEPAPADPEAALVDVKAAFESVAASLEERARSWNSDWPEEGRLGALANFGDLPDGTVRPHLAREHHRSIVHSL